MGSEESGGALRRVAGRTCRCVPGQLHSGARTAADGSNLLQVLKQDAVTGVICPNVQTCAVGVAGAVPSLRRRVSTLPTHRCGPPSDLQP